MLQFDNCIIVYWTVRAISEESRPYTVFKYTAINSTHGCLQYSNLTFPLLSTVLIEPLRKSRVLTQALNTQLLIQPLVVFNIAIWNFHYCLLDWSSHFGRVTFLQYLNTAINLKSGCLQYSNFTSPLLFTGLIEPLRKSHVLTQALNTQLLIRLLFVLNIAI